MRKPLLGYDIPVTSNDPKSQPDSQQAHDPRASQAMPWLNGPTAAGVQPGTESKPASPADGESQVKQETANNLSDPNDPDAKDLPPGVVLPDAKLYAMRQLKAQMINFIAISVFIVSWAFLVIPDKPQVGYVCSAITVTLTLFTVVRFWFARRAWLAAQQERQAQDDHP
jgi:hypothetical protein